jgi:transcription initiation factor IIE alpha subunit
MSCQYSIDVLRDMSKSVKHRPKINEIATAKMLRLLVDGPVRRDEIREETGLNINTISRCLRRLRLEGLVHIAGWDLHANGRNGIALFRFAPDKPDVKRERKSYSTKSKAYRERQALRMAPMLVTSLGAKNANPQS